MSSGIAMMRDAREDAGATASVLACQRDLMGREFADNDAAAAVGRRFVALRTHRRVEIPVLAKPMTAVIAGPWARRAPRQRWGPESVTATPDPMHFEYYGASC
jgi:hypothetical protein